MSMQSKKLAQKTAHVFGSLYHHDIHAMHPPLFFRSKRSVSVYAPKGRMTQNRAAHKGTARFLRDIQRFQSGIELAC